MFVRDWMTENVISVEVDESSQEAWNRLLENSIRRVPVLEEEELVGILSRTDLRSKLHPTDFPGHGESGKQVRDLMTEDVVTCWPDQPLEEAAAILYEHELACLPVINDDYHVVGMLSEKDFFQAFYTLFGLQKTDRREQFQMPDFESACKKGIELTEGFDMCSYHIWPARDTREFNCLLRFILDAKRNP